VYELLVVIHVLGWVFWLGTDLGVFFAAKWSERDELSVETRLTVLQLGMLLDCAPRFAVPVVWGSGMLLAARQGYPFLPGAAVLAISLVWIVVTQQVIFGGQGSAAQRYAMRAQTLFYGLVIIFMGGGGAWLLAQGEIPLWLALKGLGYTIIAVTGLLLERAFAPVGALFGELAAQGASDPLNERIHRALKPVYPIVLGIYVGTLIAGIAGLTKPTL